MIAITEETTSPNTDHPPVRRPVPATTSSGVRVWLTDDNRSFRRALVELLTRYGQFDCERQFHSAEALLEGLANDTAPDVILLDVEMGGMNGVAALRPIRTLAPDVRVLMVTSFFDPMYEARAIRDGASAYLLKAFAPQNLATEIHQALASPVRLAEVAPAPIPAHQNPGGKSMFARAALWLANLSHSFWELTLHRPAATPK